MEGAKKLIEMFKQVLSSDNGQRRKTFASNVAPQIILVKTVECLAPSREEKHLMKQKVSVQSSQE